MFTEETVYKGQLHILLLIDTYIQQLFFRDTSELVQSRRKIWSIDSQTDAVVQTLPLSSSQGGHRRLNQSRSIVSHPSLYSIRCPHPLIASRYGIDTSSVGCATNGSQILNEIFWKCTFTSNRAGIIISEKQKGDYKSADLNSAGLSLSCTPFPLPSLLGSDIADSYLSIPIGHLKLSKYIDFDALPFCEPFVDTVKIECPLFGDEIVEIKETMGVGIRDVMNQVYALYVSLSL